ncbi:tyrosine-type recombinase/integrase [Brevibacillus sp. VP]|uniref:tyrosine-type recombinase/integrase n=1 Tax=Brevibacillus sp. VP TaxID=2293326 RepID=UPI0013752E4A|nr:site-specific integrase [Brevibacillus sp. VP]
MPIYEYKKNGKTHYYYAFEVKDADGKRKTIKKRGFTGKTEAREAEREARVSWDRGLYIDPSKMTYGEYVTTWLENKQDLSEQSRYTNEGHLRTHIIPAIGNIPIQKISVINIEQFIKVLQEKGLASGTVKKIFNLVNTSLNAAAKKELINRNPIDLMDTKPRVEKKQINYWSKEEVKSFLGSCEHRLKVLFILAIYTGMRRGEILGLRWKDVDFDNGQIRIRQILAFGQKIKDGAKTSAGNRSISVPPYVLSELKKHRTMIIQEKWNAKNDYIDNDLVICDEFGKSLNLGNFHNFWVKILEKSNVRYIRFHDLRHTCASLLLSAGTHPKIVQEMLGHSSIKVTLDLYSHMTPNLQSDAVKALEQMLK